VNIDQFLGSNDGVHQALLSFETRTGRCSAVLRLRGGRCWTLLTAVSELIGFEETSRARRTNGAPLRYEPGRPDWRTERDRRRAELGVTQQPYCVIVGAGQAGLGLGARLKQLGVLTLIVDNRERPSDTWRERYATLSLHSPVWGAKQRGMSGSRGSSNRACPPPLRHRVKSAGSGTSGVGAKRPFISASRPIRSETGGGRCTPDGN
jgi:hypothetical protein